MGSALTALAVTVLISVLFGFFLVIRNFLVAFSAVLMPLAIAGILAMLLRPVVSVFEHRLKLSRIKAIVLLYALVIVVLLAVVLLAVPTLIIQVQGLIEELPTYAAAIRGALENRFPELVTKFRANFDGQEWNNIFSQYSNVFKSALVHSLEALDDAKTSVFGFFGWAAAYAVIPVYLFYLLDSSRNFSDDLEDHLSFIHKPLRTDIIFLITEFVKILVSFFRGQIIIAIILAVMLAFGFSLAGLKFGIIIGLIIGLLNIVPYLGTILGIVTVMPIAYFQAEGGVALIAFCIAVFIIAQLITDYLLTPKIMGKETGLSAMAIIFSIFFWGVALDGLLGMILAIPLSAFFAIFWRLAKQKYIPQLLGKHGQTP